MIQLMVQWDGRGSVWYQMCNIANDGISRVLGAIHSSDVNCASANITILMSMRSRQCSSVYYIIYVMLLVLC